MNKKIEKARFIQIYQSVFVSYAGAVLMLLGVIFFGSTHALAAQEDNSVSVVPGQLAARIVSLGPALTEALFRLGASDRVVGVTTYCTRPEQAKKKDRVGTAVEFDVEKVVSLRPELVVATALSDSKGLSKLRSMGIRVEVFPPIRNIDELCEEFLRLSDFVGKRPEAEELIRKVMADIAGIRGKTSVLLKPRVVIQIGANPLWVVPKDYFMNDFVELGGGENIIPAGSGHFSRERILAMNPEVIIITTMGIVGNEEKKKWEQYKSVSAVRNGRIYIVDSDKFCSPTPEGFVEVLKETVKLLHPSYE